jgi:hypothetical protein
MKKQTTLLLIFVGITFSTTAQINTSTGGAGNVLANSPTTNTNVGIGTDTPKSKLDVEGSVSIGVNYSGTRVAPENGVIIEGNVGIGTNNPTKKLEVNGALKATTGFFSNSLSNNQVFSSYGDRNDKCEVLTAGTIINQTLVVGKTFNFFDFPISNFNPYPEAFFTITDRNAKDRFAFNSEAGNSSNLRMFDKNENEIFKVSDDGNNKIILSLPNVNSFLGIGTNSFNDGTDIFRLSVNGNIRAHRVKVYTTWADYVFEKNYKLPTLQEVENQIKLNGHLFDIPSSKEVEEKGIELGEMNKLLLQKVEELTLYVIQMNKEIELLKSKSKN